MSKADGQYIAIKFTQPITSDLSTLSVSAFTVTAPEYTFVPGGELQNVVKTINSVGAYNAVDSSVDLSDGALTDVEMVGSVLQLEVDNG